MNRKYTMDVATVRGLARNIKEIQSDVYAPDNYIQSLELGLFRNILHAIADGTCADPQECAKAALEWRT